MCTFADEFIANIHTMDFIGSFSTLGGLAALTVVITGFLNKTFKVEKGWVKQLISWLVPVIVSILGFVLHLGLFAAFGPLAGWAGWVYTLLTGLGVGLIPNGIYDVNGVKTALDWLTQWIDTLRAKKANNPEKKA